MKPENVTCPECDGPMVSRSSAHGVFWGCKAFPRCRGTRNVDGEARRSRREEEADRLPSDRLRDRDRRRWRISE
jgi:ssDNA-binding Zn-finger/Zn-ribbon topoisomerase 1